MSHSSTCTAAYFLHLVCNHCNNSGFILGSLWIIALNQILNFCYYDNHKPCTVLRWPLLLILDGSANCRVAGTSRNCCNSHTTTHNLQLPPYCNYTSGLLHLCSVHSSPDWITDSHSVQRSSSAAAGNTGANGQTTAATTLKAGAASLSAACRLSWF